MLLIAEAAQSRSLYIALLSFVYIIYVRVLCVNWNNNHVIPFCECEWNEWMLVERDTKNMVMKKAVVRNLTVQS